MSISTNLCRFCGRPLSHRRSVERGYGPGCGKKNAERIAREKSAADQKAERAWKDAVESAR